MKYDSCPIQDSPHVVGENRPDGTRLVAQVEGTASFGPYCTLEPGDYFCGFQVRGVDVPTTEQFMMIDVVGGRDGKTLAAEWMRSDQVYRDQFALIGVNVSIDEQTHDLEVRLYSPGVGSFEISRKVMFRRGLG